LQNSDGCTPFYIACEKGNLNIVRILLVAYQQAGLDIHTTDTSGVSALHIATDRQQVQIVKILLEAGGISCLITNEGMTAKMINANRNSDIRRLLRDARCCRSCKVKARKVCFECLSTYYCDKSCQKLDWSRHKYDCKLIRNSVWSKIGV
jgi:hypothetical protein